MIRPLALCTLALAAPVLAQQLPDCRTAEGRAAPSCSFLGSPLPVQHYLGTTTFNPGNQPAALFAPLLPEIAVSPTPKRDGHHFEFSAYYAIQSQFLNFQNHNSDGYKVSFAKQWNDLLGIEVRGSVLQYDLIKAGAAAGRNGTEAIAFGPRVQHSFGRVTPYGEFLIGALDQFEPGLSVSGVAGIKVRLTRHWYWTPVDAEYRYALLQTDSRLIGGRNPLRGRVELATGATYRW